jgi:hypothetical protein
MSSPAAASAAQISGTAAAAASEFTVMRTISDPALASSRICLTVAVTSAVSVLVMDCTTTGAAPPITTLPTVTGVLRRVPGTGLDLLMAGFAAWFTGRVLYQSWLKSFTPAAYGNKRAFGAAAMQVAGRMVRRQGSCRGNSKEFNNYNKI